MHLCLELDDIQSEIFGYVYDPSAMHWIVSPLRDRKSLAALAVTCRAFYESAMDVLWSELDSLAPLVKCMPPNMWQMEKDTDVSGRIDPTRVADTLVSRMSLEQKTTDLSVDIPEPYVHSLK